MADRSVFETLNSINVNGHTEKKNGLTYLSWAWAWAEVKKAYPDATYTIYENRDGLFYHTDGNTCWVKTGVNINGIEHIEYLPVMDFKNKSIPVAAVTSFDVNKAIQRSLTKAVARHGLGLYIYAGEDLPECDEQQEARPAQQRRSAAQSATPAAVPDPEESLHHLLELKLREDGIAPSWFCDKHGIRDIADLTDSQVKKVLTNAYWQKVRDAYKQEG